MSSNLEKFGGDEDATETCSQASSSSDDETYFKPKEVVGGGNALKLKFYSQVLEDGSRNIHFGKVCSVVFVVRANCLLGWSRLLERRHYSRSNCKDYFSAGHSF